MGTDTNFSKSGSSPGNVGKALSFSGGSPPQFYSFLISNDRVLWSSFSIQKFQSAVKPCVEQWQAVTPTNARCIAFGGFSIEVIYGKA
jgi:hypothetical protein